MSRRAVLVVAAITVMAASLVSAAVVQGAQPIPVNVAEGRPVLQSSTMGDGFAERAVDGNSHGVFGHGSVSQTNRDLEPWWEVDLGESFELVDVVLWNRTDCCAERLADVHVFVSDDPFSASDISGTAAQDGVGHYTIGGVVGESARLDIGRSARYVRVQLEGEAILSLAEVEVFSMVGQVGQDSDGEFDVDVFVDGMAASAAPGPLVGVGEHLVTFEVVNQTSEDLWSIYLWAEGLGRVPCPQRHLRAGERMVCEGVVALDLGSFASQVEAAMWDSAGDRHDSNPTVFADVQNDQGGERVNLALGRPARQSESEPGHPAQLAVDGNRDGDAAAGSVAITHRIVEAYWQVDLGEVAQIDEIVIWNRTDCCSERLRDFHVFVSDAPMDLVDLQYTMALPDIFDHHQLESSQRRTVIPVGRTGRYVRIQVEYREAILQLAEVEVMGLLLDRSQLPEPTGPPAPGSPLTFEAGIDGLAADGAPGPELSPGSSFEFTYQLTNTGDQTLWALYLWHDGIGGVGTCPSRRLDPGGTVECRLPATAAAGQYSVVVEASAWDGGGTQFVARDAVNYLGSDGGAVGGPAIDLEVLIGGSENPAPGPELVAGGPVVFTYRIINVGDVQLWSPAIWHEGLGAVDCVIAGLAPGEEASCEFTATAQAGETAADVYLAMWDAVGARAADIDTVFYVGTTAVGGPALEVESTVEGEDADTPPGPVIVVGAPLTWVFTVTNVGSETLWGLWLRDPELDGIRCDSHTLQPGESVVCRVEAAPGEGIHAGEVTAKAWAGDGTEVSDTDRHHYVITQEGAGVEIEALIDGLDGWWDKGPRIQEGEEATFSYLVSNTGSAPLEEITVTDDRLGEISCPFSRLEPGTMGTCIARERMRLGAYVTFARVSAVAGGSVVADDERLAWHVKTTGRNAQIAFEVTVNGNDASNPPGILVPAGETVQIRYVLTNLGTWTSLYSMEINDPRVPAGQMSCPPMGSMYLGSIVCTATVTASVGEQSSLVVARAWSANSPMIEATDTYHLYGAP